eukprot:m.160315 g.160315  ORF g.160315 m.160315 type:complete len:68 (-) comp24819_c1_seq2:86-289(-)
MEVRGVADFESVRCCKGRGAGDVGVREPNATFCGSSLRGMRYGVGLTTSRCWFWTCHGRSKRHKQQG